jgi:hypothetical protein
LSKLKSAAQYGIKVLVCFSHVNHQTKSRELFNWLGSTAILSSAGIGNRLLSRQREEIPREWIGLCPFWMFYEERDDVGVNYNEATLDESTKVVKKDYW